MTHRSGNGHGSRADLTSAVLMATSGRPSDVEVLLARLDTGELCTPLARSLPGVEEGAQLELTDDITLVPHMLVDDQGHAYCALFTRAEFMEPFGIRLGWDTEGGPLQYAAFSARAALEMAVHVMSGDEVFGVVINAGDASELVLRPHEVSALLSGRVIPLESHSKGSSEAAAAGSPVGQDDGVPPPEFVAALESQIAAFPVVLSYELTRTTDSEGDSEPHLTLHLRLAPGDVDTGEIVAAILEGIQDVLPPPGYIDIAVDD